MTEVRSIAETFGNFATTAFCSRAEAAGVGDPAHEHVESRRVFQHAGRKDDEEVRLKTFPIDLAQTRDSRLDRDALHVEDQLVADLRAEDPSRSPSRAKSGRYRPDGNRRGRSIGPP